MYRTHGRRFPLSGTRAVHRRPQRREVRRDLLRQTQNAVQRLGFGRYRPNPSGMELRTLCRLPRQRLQARNPADDRRIVPPVVRRRRTRRTPLDRLGSAGRHAGRGVHGKSRTAGRAAAPQGVVPIGRSPQPDFRRAILPRGATGVYRPIAERRRGERSIRHDSYFPIFRPFMSNASAHPSAIM